MSRLFSPTGAGGSGFCLSHRHGLPGSISLSEVASGRPRGSCSSLHFSLVKTSHPLLRRNEVSVLSLASSQHSPLRIWIPGANRPGIGTFYWGFPLVSWSLVSHQVDRRTARARTLVLAAGPAQLMGQWGAGAQGNDVRKGLTGSDIPFQNNYLYKTDTLQMYSKDRDIHTYVQMLYIHLFTMTYMLLRSL